MSSSTILDSLLRSSSTEGASAHQALQPHDVLAQEANLMDARQVASVYSATLFLKITDNHPEQKFEPFGATKPPPAIDLNFPLSNVRLLFNRVRLEFLDSTRIKNWNPVRPVKLPAGEIPYSLDTHFRGKQRHANSFENIQTLL